MYADRGVTLLAHPDQWARCAHQDTVLLPEGGVGLDWRDPPEPGRWDGQQCRPRPQPGPPPQCPSGLAYDRWCRSYRTRPLVGTIEVTAVGTTPTPAARPNGLRHPTGVAVDGRDRLYVVEAGGGAVLVCDLWSGRTLRRVPVAGRPVDVVAHGCRALVLTRAPDALVLLDGRVGPRPGPQLRGPCSHHAAYPARLTILGGDPVVLWRDGDLGVVSDTGGRVLLEMPGATDLEGTSAGMLLVAGQPGASFRRFALADEELVEDEPLSAPAYDGGAVTVDPSGRPAYTSADGRRGTQGSSAWHVREGTVTTYRLDSGTYATRWGRVFVQACLPTGTTITVRSVTTDEDTVADPVPAAPPSRGQRTVPSPEHTPPLVSQTALGSAEPSPVFRTRLPLPGAEAPGADADADTGMATYECPVGAAPGRYLWLQLHLSGTERTSPRVRSVQVERPGHQLLAALPRTWSTVDPEADFLHRFLTPPEGTLHDLDTAAAQRAVLVDPRSTPTDALPWLASFAGLVLDGRWGEAARRQLVAEAYQLYARRGTQAAIERMLTLYLGRTARIVELWRLRGLGGAVLGLTPEGLHAPTVVGNARATGMLGHFTVGGQTAATTSYRTHAHRFTVLVPGHLDDEQRTVVDTIVRRQKPSHTMVNVCEIGDGLPVGRLRLGLTAYVGPCRARPTAVLGQVRVGRDAALGSPSCGARLDEARVGQVRVG